MLQLSRIEGGQRPAIVRDHHSFHTSVRQWQFVELGACTPMALVCTASANACLILALDFILDCRAAADHAAAFGAK
jgi:hypothetical protein